MGSLRTRKPLPLKPIKTIKEEDDGPTDAEEDEPLSPKARLFHAPGLSCCTISILASKTKLDIDFIVKSQDVLKLSHPRFKKVLVVDGEEMNWRKTKVNYEDHIIQPDINLSAIESPDKFVEDYIANLTTSPMDTSKPLWEMHLLDIKTSDAAGYVIGRFHHSMGDGVSLMSMLFKLSHRRVQLPWITIQAKYQRLQSGPGKQLQQPPSLTISKGSIRQAFLRFCAILAVYWNSFIDIFFYLMTILFLRDTKTPLYGDPGEVHSRPKRFMRHSFYLSDVKLVKDAMKVTVNDVLLGITEAGLSRYLNRRYGQGKQGEQASGKVKNHLPRNILLRATHYVNLRMNFVKDEVMAGSQVGHFLLPLSIGLYDDPLECIRRAKAISDRKKRSYEALFTLWFSRFMLNTFGLKAAGKMYYRLLSNTTITYSNLIGSFEEIDFLGHPLDYIGFVTYGYPRTLALNFISYVDKLMLLVAVDEKAIPDPHQLCEDIETALKLAIDACSVSD